MVVLFIPLPLVAQALGEVDTAFIQATEHRPKLAIVEADDIPLIDLSVLNSPNLSKPDTAATRPLIFEIAKACKNWCFFQVINHGVPLEWRKNLEITTRKLFALSKEEKKKVRRDEVNPLGYYDTEHTKNVRDWKEVFDLIIQNPTLFLASHEPDDKELREYFNQWPDNPPELRIPCALVILAQDDVGGLEMKQKANGKWIRVKPIRGAYIINVGDIIQTTHTKNERFVMLTMSFGVCEYIYIYIQVWSNERYESVEQKAVVNSEKDRLSIPFFFNPAHYTMVEPLKELTDDQNPTKYKAYNWGKFFATRRCSNFQKLDVENIQISHFRLSQKSG
ncbi:unnamed protein product [Ilex paraguariensis]|uniref:Uncharacterized protein n=2 Tax=Ilex paraguariensis TaxID=185542 RepID=A0ABC8UFF6_9AQUA